jgi:hypothetical protein
MLALPHAWIQHFFVISVGIAVIIDPVVDAFSFSKPFFVVLIKFALLDVFIQLDIVSFSQNS